MMLRNLFAAAAVALLSGCASTPADVDDSRVAYDPAESLNRGIYKFNDGLDRVTTKPLARGYQAITPSPVRRGIGNFFHNLTVPRSALNNFLQGKPDRGLDDVARLLLNSTIGIGGLFDFASYAGLERYDEDFGQTLAVWGVPDGPFVTLPILGPRTLRDAFTEPLDMFAYPLYHYDNSSVRDPLVVLRIIDLREGLLSAEELLKDSKDPYVTIRESYLQNRRYEIFDGEPPVDDDDLYDELFDNEDFGLGDEPETGDY